MDSKQLTQAAQEVAVLVHQVGADPCKQWAAAAEWQLAMLEDLRDLQVSELARARMTVFLEAEGHPAKLAPADRRRLAELLLASHKQPEVGEEQGAGQRAAVARARQGWRRWAEAQLAQLAPWDLAGLPELAGRAPVVDRKAYRAVAAQGTAVVWLETAVAWPEPAARLARRQWAEAARALPRARPDRIPAAVWVVAVRAAGPT